MTLDLRNNIVHWNLQVFLIGLIASCCKGKKSVIEGVDEDDSDISDDEPSAYSIWQPSVLKDFIKLTATSHAFLMLGWTEYLS